MPRRARCYCEEDQGRVSSRHPPPLIDDFAEDLADSLSNVFPSDDEMLAQLRALVRHRDEISPNVRQLLINELQALAARATEFAKDLAEYFDASAALKIVEPMDEDQPIRYPNEGDALIVAESPGAVNSV